MSISHKNLILKNKMTHCVKNVSIRSYSGPNAAKIQTRISPNTGAFYAVDDKLETLISNIFQGLIKKMQEYLKHLFQKKLVAIYFALSHCFLKHNLVSASGTVATGNSFKLGFLQVFFLYESIG